MDHKTRDLLSEPVYYSERELMAAIVRNVFVLILVALVVVFYLAAHA